MPRFRIPRELILTAQEGQVERILTEALGGLTPEEIESLPVECRLLVTDPAVDIHTSAVTFLQSDLKYRGDTQIGELVRQLAELFASASVRLSQIEHRRFPA